MTVSAQRNQVVEFIGSGVRTEVLVMYFEVGGPSTLLTMPPIAP
jgi:hypothetical protein